MSVHEVTIDVGGRSLSIETGRMARLAAGSVVVRFGETMVISAASSSPPRPGLNFFPLTIDYREKTYSAGKIPGGFLKRESAPSPKEILTMRMADRPIRPLWPKGFKTDLQCQTFVISYDQMNDPDVLSINGAGASVALADLPFLGPIGAVRVGLIDGEYVAFPDNVQRAESDMDMVVAGTKNAVTMVEGGMNEVSEEVAIGAIAFAHEVIKKIVAAIEELREMTGWTQPEFESPEDNDACNEAVEAQFGEAFEKAVYEPVKLDRNKAKRAVIDEIRETLAETEDETDGRFPGNDINDAISKLEKKIIRKAALSGERIDGRKTDDVRDITVEVGLLPRAHGSALFTRGETQALVASTLGTGHDEKMEDGLHQHAFTKKYYLHYNFPPMCVGETRPIRGPSRREVGHGALAERSLLPVLPAMEEFPYTIRVVSDILMSNGSSSMASVCGTTLSMMDAGIQIKRPVAGIAMGLVQEGDDYAVLSDILGDEDHAGDMDFKVAGSQNGITALQMDIKMTGVSEEILETALAQAKEGRMHILREMLKAIDKPREEYNQYAPRVEVVHIKPSKIGMLIGPGGKNIRRIQEESGATIEVDDEGMVKIFAHDGESAANARKQVEAIAEEATVGKIYDGKVTSIKDFGAFLEIIPGIEGLCHISELADGYVGNVEDVLSMGEITPVKVILVDESGRVKLSRKQALQDLGQDASAPEPSGDRPPRRDDRGPRRDGGRGRGGDRGGRGGRGGDRGGRGGDRGGRGRGGDRGGRGGDRGGRGGDRGGRR
ncbi:MAG: polyribonucleotide nucleotidyltransferase [Planctomycetota bacterium]|nr:polyribonucleotide nucleotidyltransferase [Planctomycetota bacterium]